MAARIGLSRCMEHEYISARNGGRENAGNCAISKPLVGFHDVKNNCPAAAHKFWTCTVRRKTDGLIWKNDTCIIIYNNNDAK